MMTASLTIHYNLKVGLILVLVMIGLTACGSDNDDLDEYINSVKATPGGYIQPLDRKSVV